MNLHEQTGLSLAVSHPLWRTGGYIETLTDRVGSWQHIISALGGFDRASTAMPGDLSFLEDWFEGGLGRDVVCHNGALEVAWEGFVNRVAINVGGFHIERGPLLDVANRVRMLYCPIDDSVTPPVVGAQERTGNFDGGGSQARYGIQEAVLETQACTAQTAGWICDTYLAEHKDPETTHSFSAGGGDLSVNLELLGYGHWMNRYVYNSAADGTQDLDAKIMAILGTDPNGLLSTDYSRVAANTMAVTAWENEDSTAWALVKDLVARGNTAAARYLFGVYEGRRASYRAAPTAITYRQYLGAPGQWLEKLSGTQVMPWDMRPGKWLFISDFLAGRTPPLAPATMADLRADPRCAFLEQVTYTAPMGFSWVGGKTDNMEQRLGRLGLGGFGA